MRNIHNTLPVARAGLPFILGPLGLAAAAWLAGGLFIAVPAAALGIFSLWFFRDPERTPPPGDSAVLSPADGTVIEITRVDADPFLNREMQKISIFMSVFNVHVNRAPVSGRVERVSYRPGKFLVASLDKASSDNERNAVVMTPDGGEPIVVVQIAGLIARRIACWVQSGDEVVRGQRFGLIRFGSRLDVYLPPAALVEARIGEKVAAGRSILGFLA